jgi:hypothetical protein
MTTETVTMTPREEAIPLLAQVVYDQAHKNTSVSVTVHGVDWDTYQAVDAEEQFARGEHGKVTAWKVAKLVDDWSGLEVTYFPSVRVVES